MTTERDLKPYLCPEHPRAQIRHEWTRDQTRVHLTGATFHADYDHQYFCAECGRELAEPTDD